MILYQWALRHGIPMTAIKELQVLMGVEDRPGAVMTGLSEAAVQNNLRLEASRVGARLWRNNVGAFHDTESDTFVRFGLANESEKMNKIIKSSDLVGIRPVLITPAMVGQVIGQFMCREAKPGNWRYGNTEREEAQLKWIMLIISLGGDAAFATSEGTI